MKLLHISDLHIGKRVKGYSLLEDQIYILQQIINTVKERKIDGVIIAGDIYDITTPSNEAINCFDEFISELHFLKVACYIVSGNHDSIYRVSFGSNIMAKENIYIAKKYMGKIYPITIKENVKIWLLPFIRPYDVREYHPDFANSNYEEMMKVVVDNMAINTNEINILVAHQFITCGNKLPEKSESESISLGTLENIDFSVFENFNYVALGHIHKPQVMGKNTVRYAGSPLKYSFSEKNDNKSMVLLNITDNKIDTELIPFKPLRDMREFTGMFEDLVKLEKTNDYARIVLKDEKCIVDVKHKLEGVFPNVMEIVYDNLFTKNNSDITKCKFTEEKSPLELFKDFYEMQNNQKLDEIQLEIITNVLKEMENSCK